MAAMAPWPLISSSSSTRPADTANLRKQGVGGLADDEDIAVLKMFGRVLFGLHTHNCAHALDARGRAL